MTHIPEELHHQSKSSFDVQRNRPLLPPLQDHPKRFASKCYHELHPSASSHTPYCTACIVKTAQMRLEKAQAEFMIEGGLNRTWALRDRRWVQARLKYYTALRGLEKARKRDQLRWEWEHAWDELHLGSKLDQMDGERKNSAASECSACSYMMGDNVGLPLQKVSPGRVWWERPGILAHPPEPKTPPRSRYHRRVRAAKGSPSMRSIIHDLRTALLTTTSEQQIWQTRYRTEAAVRRKHHLGKDNQFEPSFWDTPVSGLTVQESYRQAQEIKRMAERRARGNTPRARPPGSSLSYCESADELVVDEELKEAMRLSAEADELQRIERAARKVGEEVGYLYFVGAIDGLKTWGEDVVRSDHNLVWRDRGEPMEGVEMV